MGFELHAAGDTDTVENEAEILKAAHAFVDTARRFGSNVWGDFTGDHHGQVDAGSTHDLETAADPAELSGGTEEAATAATTGATEQNPPEDPPAADPPPADEPAAADEAPPAAPAVDPTAGIDAELADAAARLRQAGDHAAAQAVEAAINSRAAQAAAQP